MRHHFKLKIMRKLSKLKLKEFQEMSSSEMKNVVGGYQVSEHCPVGEYLFTCHVDFVERPSDNSGAVCATSAGNAKQKVEATLKVQGVFDEYVRVTCSGNSQYY